MQRDQKSLSNSLLVSVIVLLLIVAGYLVYSGSVADDGSAVIPVPEKIVENNQQFIKTENSKLESLQNDKTTTSIARTSYPELGFSAVFPKESISEKINIEDTENGAILHVKYPSFQMSLFVMNSQFTGGCSVSADGKKEVINGQTFTVHDSGGEFSGIDSKAVAKTYCIENGGLKYEIVPFISYVSTSGGYSPNNPNPGPDKQTSFGIFDKAVKELDIRF
jgi:hypothetical protein